MPRSNPAYDIPMMTHQAHEYRAVAACCRANARLSVPYYAATWETFAAALDKHAKHLEKRIKRLRAREIGDD